MTDPVIDEVRRVRKLISDEIGPDLVGRRQSDLCIAVGSSTCLVIGAQWSGSGVCRIDLAVTLVNGDAQLLRRLNRLVCIDLVPSGG